MRWIYAILAYGLLILSCALTLYFLELDGIQKELKKTTETVLQERLKESPTSGAGDFEFSADFSASKGHVSGIADTATGMLLAQEAVETLAAEGLPEEAQTEHDFTELTHDWRRHPSFQVRAQGEEIALRAELAPSTLAILEQAILEATGANPGPPLDPEASSPEAKAIGLDDIAVPDWEDSFGPAVQYFFQFDRLLEPELMVTADRELRLIGIIDTEEQADTLKEIMSLGFPSLAKNIVNMLEVQRESPALELKEENGILTLEVAVPSTEIRTNLIEHLQSQLAPGQPLEAAIQVLPKAANPEWLETKPTFFKRFLAEVKSPRIVISKDVVRLGGIAPSKAIADELANLVQAQLSGHTVDNGLTYPNEADSP